MTAPSISPARYGAVPLPVAWQLAGLDLTRGPDPHGCWWSVSKVRGWRGTAKPRTNRDPRPTASGEFRGAAYRGGRVIVLDGQTRCPSAAGRADAEERLAQLFPDRDDVDLWPLWRVGENGVAQVRYVELDDEIEPVPLGPRWFEWSIQVAAPDPRKFGPWQSVQVGAPTPGAGGIVSTGNGIVSTGQGIAAGTAGKAGTARVVGEGSARNPVVYQLLGPMADVTAAESSGSARHRWFGAIPDGVSVFINTDDQTAYDVPGAPGPIPAFGALFGTSNARHALLRTGGFPQLTPGADRLFSVTGTVGAAARFTVHSRAAWD